MKACSVKRAISVRFYGPGKAVAPDFAENAATRVVYAGEGGQRAGAVIYPFPGEGRGPGGKAPRSCATPATVVMPDWPRPGDQYQGRILGAGTPEALNSHAHAPRSRGIHSGGANLLGLAVGNGNRRRHHLDEQIRFGPRTGD